MAAGVAQEPSLQSLSYRNNAQPLGSRKKGPKKRVAWSDADLQDAIKALDTGYTFGKVSQAFNIPKSSLRDHYLGKRISRKIGGKGVLTKEEDEALCKYVLDMAEIGLPLTPIQLQQKATKITQERPTPFTNGMPGRSWLKWFLHRHPEILFRSSQILDQKRARALNSNTTKRFYQNLSDLYE